MKFLRLNFFVIFLLAVIASCQQSRTSNDEIVRYFESSLDSNWQKVYGSARRQEMFRGSEIHYQTVIREYNTLILRNIYKKGFESEDYLVYDFDIKQEPNRKLFYVWHEASSNLIGYFWIPSEN